MFKIKLVSWAMFLLVLNITPSEPVTDENMYTSEQIVPLALYFLSLIQLDMVYRYGKKKKTGRLIRGAGNDSTSMPRVSPKQSE